MAQLVFWSGMAAGLGACAYLFCALLGIRRFARRKLPAGDFRPPVSVLKPVSGLDVALYDNLRSFCEQDYPEFQVIIGVRGADDPALPEIRRVIDDLPGRDIALVVNSSVHGANLKVSNLCNMEPLIRHPLLVIADSDMRVGRDYLASVVAPFADPAVGAVTCLYRGIPQGGRLSRLASLWFNEWFLPSVLVAQMTQEVRFCFGATMAVRREILERCGGFLSLADFLADDYMIGKFAADCGNRVEISRYIVDAMVEEESFKLLFQHELRWARTMRAQRPAGYSFSFLTNTISVGLIAFASSSAVAPWAGAAVLGLATGLRVLLHYRVAGLLGGPPVAPLWMVPVRDALSFAVWVASYFGNSVSWRGRRYAIAAHGRLVPAP